MPLQPLAAGLLVLQVLALRYIAGSWLAAGLMAWLPFVPRELVTGNVDVLMAAAIYASIRNVPRSGYAIALFAAMKFSPAAALVLASRRQWREAIIAGAIFLAITLPVLQLWPEWFSILGSADSGSAIGLRAVIGLVLVVSPPRGPSPLAPHF